MTPDTGTATATREALRGPGDDSVLRRKARRHRVVAEVRMTPEKAFRFALAKAARDQLAMALGVTHIDYGLMSLAELLEMPAERALLCMIESEGEGLGLMMLDADTLAGVIEQQTMGRILRTATVPRLPTRTDAAMAAGFVDSALDALALALMRADLRWAAGWRYASFLEDARPLPLLLDDGAHHVLRASLAFPVEGRGGRVVLALPAAARSLSRRSDPAPATSAAASASGRSPAEAGGWSTALRAAVLCAPAELDGVLVRVQLSLGQALALAPGQRIALPGADVAEVALEAGGARDTPPLRVTTGRLGQCRGFRALKLHPPTEG